MNSSCLIGDKCLHSSSNLTKPLSQHKQRSRKTVVLASNEEFSGTRRVILGSAGALLLPILTFDIGLTPSLVRAEEKINPKDLNEDDGDKGILDGMKSLFDPNEKTKSGKVLPKAYLKTAREVVKTLRESVEEDPKDNAKFRRTADAAKESIREYLSNWRGQKSVASEESYMALEKAIRALAGFYSKAGPSAQLPEDVKLQILDDLNIAELSL
ncbi:photosystem II D1 precursor processing protein PSB27-H2, chloroplastic-like [Papaver somniferum]|uniref:photosystem II D1 precursor processing protein PSB27-H2, chloroplastic-like n=1 Tax=Papaver somniferum TaxID=3469 RepID=UPI000E6FEEB0|nr:photosystem II D1 precursor processing protein PSB27-H2, chloroplastic-like [Papaver somniferum]